MKPFLFDAEFFIDGFETFWLNLSYLLIFKLIKTISYG